MIETKEHASVSWPATDTPDPSPPEALSARDALIAEWQASNPQTPEEIAEFYRTSTAMQADLNEWHALPDRQLVTDMLVAVAQKADAQRIVDIGCGAGHDLAALRQALPEAFLCGVEPNRALREHGQRWDEPTQYCFWDVADAPIEQTDLLICIDVLEHLPDPAAFLTDIATRAPVGCYLFEATASFDTGTPLHLVSNRGWHPGHVLEKHGWGIVDVAGKGDRVRVWQRHATEGPARAHLLLCAYRNVTTESLQSIMALTAGAHALWRLKIKAGDSLISRSRSIMVTHWWRATADDVFLLVDDDITFSPGDADHVAQLCREGLDIVCGAYPVGDGGHFACRTLPGTEHVLFGPGQDAIEIQYAATGFLAVHRRVIDAMISAGGSDGSPLPLCHAAEPWSFYPLFPTPIVEHEKAGGWEMLSEDWGFCHKAREMDFRVWLDPTVVLQHTKSFPISVRNMNAVHAAIQQV